LSPFEGFFVGSTGKHGFKKFFPLRKVLIASGVTVAAALAATAWILAGSGSKSRAAASQAEADLSTRTTSATPAQSATPSASPSAAPSATPTTATPTLRPKAAATPKKKKATAAYRVVRTGTCEASFYGEGQQTASGESFNPSALTAANKTMPFGTKVRVTNKANGESVIVRINDRGPYAGGRCLDLSTAAMRAVGGLSAGVIDAKYEVLAKS
jgi:rare lipoprotein A